MTGSTRLTNLRNLLAELYPEEASLRRLMADAGLNAARISPDTHNLYPHDPARQTRQPNQPLPRPFCLLGGVATTDHHRSGGADRQDRHRSSFPR
jgi:hypothetical protein